MLSSPLLPLRRSALAAPALCWLALTGGCVVERTQAFSENEYAPFAGQGSGAIEGRAVFRAPGGAIKHGGVVHLDPVTSTSREFLREAILGGRALEAPDPRAAAYHRRVHADGEGRFRFAGLPAGRYLIHCPVEWYAPVRGVWPQGGILYGEVEVPAGQTVRVELEQR